MSSHHNTDSKVSKKNIFAPNDGSSVQHAEVDSPGKKKPEFIQMEKMDTQSSRMSVNGYRSKMAFKTGGIQAEPSSAGLNQMLSNGI